jgi:hypothetical protein
VNETDMDVISTLTAARPAPPADAEQIRQRARGRLEATLLAAEPHRPVRSSRSRRWMVLGAAGLTAAAGAAIAVPAVLPSGAGPFVTKAWAVTRGPGGTVTITINQALGDQAELQRVLRADGVPAYVRSMSRCAIWKPRGGFGQMVRGNSNALLFPAPGNNDTNFKEIIIHVAALSKNQAIFIGGSPTSTGLALQLYVMRNNHPPVCDQWRPSARPGSAGQPRS